MSNQDSDTIYAIVCEGNSEKAIIDILVENDCLFFDKNKLLNGEVLKVRSAKNFEEKIWFSYEKMILFRIIDSRNEKFNLSKIHRDKIEIINCYTRPEIEMLIIIAENKYDDFLRKYKSIKKPSEYIKQNMKVKDIKSYIKVKEYFSDINLLLSVLNKYETITKNKGESIINLLKDDLIENKNSI